MKKTLKVNIIGFTGTGKSALAHGIKDLCAKHGIECSISGAEDDMKGVVEESWPERLDAMANKDIAVEITTVQAIRHGL